MSIRCATRGRPALPRSRLSPGPGHQAHVSRSFFRDSEQGVRGKVMERGLPEGRLGWMLTGIAEFNNNLVLAMLSLCRCTGFSLVAAKRLLLSLRWLRMLQRRALGVASMVVAVEAWLPTRPVGPSNQGIHLVSYTGRWIHTTEPLGKPRTLPS